MIEMFCERLTSECDSIINDSGVSETVRALVQNFKSECERVAAGGDFTKTPLAFRLRGLNMIAVSRDGSNLRLIPEERRDSDIVKAAIRNDGCALQHVPKGMRSQELCDLAVESCASALIHVPKRQRTAGLCRKMISAHPDCLALLSANAHVPEDVLESVMTRELCELVVRSDGNLVRHVRKWVSDYDLCMLAAEHGADLSSIPPEFRDYAMCFAVARGGGIMERGLVPADCSTPDLWLQAARGNARNVRHFPRRMLTYETCLKLTKESVSKDDSPALHIPEKFRTIEMLAAAMEKGRGGNLPRILARYRWGSAIPENQRDETRETHMQDSVRPVSGGEAGERAWLDFLSEFGGADLGILQCIPVPMRSESVCAAAVSGFGMENLKYVPLRAKTRDFFLLLMEKTPCMADVIDRIDPGIINTDFHHRISILIGRRAPDILDRWNKKAVRAGVEIATASSQLPFLRPERAEP